MPNLEPKPLLLTVRDAARMLTLSEWTCRKWIEQGRLPIVRLGRRVAVEMAVIQRIIAAGRAGGGR